MDNNEMAQLFSNSLKQLEALNKNTEILNITLIKLDDSIAHSNEINENLKKVNATLGSVMAQGLSGKLNMEAVDKVVGYLARFLGK